jgi:hypothetical protein
VTSHVDTAAADEILAALEPALSEEEHALAIKDGGAPAPMRLSAALRAVLDRKALRVNAETFEFILWKISLERQSTERLRQEVAFPEAKRRVRDGGGIMWDVYPMVESLGWNGEAAVPRGSWLCFTTKGERRYLTPLPVDWEKWTDAELQAVLISAPVDKRRV